MVNLNNHHTTRAEISHRSDSSHRPEVGRRPEISHRSDVYQWSDASHRQDAGHRSDGIHCADAGHCSDAGHRPDAGHRIDQSHRLDNVHRVEGNQRIELSHHSDVPRSDGGHRPEIPHRKESGHHLEAPHSHIQVDATDRSSLRSDPHHRHDFSHRDVGHTENLWRPDNNDPINYQRDERRLPSMPLPENSHSLPPHHSHGMHHQVHTVGQTHHSHSYGRQHQAPMPSMEMPSPVPGQDLDQKDRKGGSKIPIPQLANVPKSGTGVYEDSFHPAVVETSHLHTATLRRGKHHHSHGSNGMGTLRRNPVPVATPKLAPPQAVPVPNEPSSSPASASVVSISSAINIPPPVIPPLDPHNSLAASNASSTAAVVAAIVAASPPRCTCPKAAALRCTCPGSCHGSGLSSAVNEHSVPQNSNLSLTQSGLDDNDDYRSECENCKSTHSSNYYLDAEDPEPEITMTLHRKPADTGEENGNGYYRTSLTLPTRHRVLPLHGAGARDNWFSSMPESSSEEESEEE